MRFSIRSILVFVFFCAVACVWPISHLIRRATVLSKLRSTRVSIQSNLNNEQKELKKLMTTAAGTEHNKYFPDDHESIQSTCKIVSLVTSRKLPPMPTMNNARLESAIRSCDRAGRSTDSLVCDASKIMYRVVQLQQRLDLVETSISRIDDIPFWSSIDLDGEPSDAPKDRALRFDNGKPTAGPR